MSKYASKVVKQAVAWLGKNEADGSHKGIIDIYNSHKPRARGYKVCYTDEWCATTVSAIAIKLGYTDIIPTECSCNKMIELFKKLGSWVENENRTPKPGEIIFYDWQDNGKGDNKGRSDHVGVVEKVIGNQIVVIEGNKKERVARRYLEVNGRYIRGYGVPKYDAETSASKTTYTLKNFIRDVQSACGAKVDGIAGLETITKTITVSETKNRKHVVVMAIQQRLNALGYNCGEVDGIAGPKFTEALKAFQKANKCTADGEATARKKTWQKLLGMI